MEGTITDQRTLTKIKYLFLILLDDILPKQSHIEKLGEDRHPLVKYFHKCVAGDVSKEIVNEVTHLILSFDFGTTLIEHQLHLANGRFYFESYIFRYKESPENIRSERRDKGQEGQKGYTTIMQEY